MNAELYKISGKGPDVKPMYSALLRNDQIVNEDFLMKLNSIKKVKNPASNRAVKSKPVPQSSKKRSSTTSLTGQAISELEGLSPSELTQSQNQSFWAQNASANAKRDKYLD